MVTEFELGFWLMVIDAAITYSIQFSLTALGQSMLIKDYGYDEAEAGELLMLPYIIVCFLMPVVGMCADSFGRR